MKLFAPDYYCDFHCIADKCKHSCCIGWEIDIDPDTADYYSEIPGKFGEKLRGNIDLENSCFKLCENERCPFLNEKGLCEIIINLGEEALCQICSDHPRFRNFFSDRTEIGLGLCCEEAARLILDKKTKTEIVLLGDEGLGEELFAEEKDILSLRNKAFAIVQNREKDIEHRIEELLSLSYMKFPRKTEKEWAKRYYNLECLNKEWTSVLGNMKDGDFEHAIDPTAEEQLLCYFLFRHLAAAAEDYRAKERIAFCVLSLYMIRAAAKQLGIYEAARLYSSEIEYSDENTDTLLDILSTESEE